MKERLRLAAIIALGVCGVITVTVVDGRPQTLDIVVLGAALVAGYLVELRPANRAPLPMGFAVVLILLRATSPVEFVAVVSAASLMTVILRTNSWGLAVRLLVFAEILSEGIGAGAVYRVIADATSGAGSRAAVLGALFGAAITQILIADLVVFAREHRVAPIRARGADLALVTSGMLMAVGYGGISGRGRLGLWGPLLFAIPLFAAWYSFEFARPDATHVSPDSAGARCGTRAGRTGPTRACRAGGCASSRAWPGFRTFERGARRSRDSRMAASPRSRLFR